MRIIIQRVRRGSVAVDGEVIGRCGRGFVVLVGVTHGDGETQAQFLAGKIANLRVFEDSDGKMNLSLLDLEPHGEVLLISQFTLYAEARKGRRPSFTQAAPPEIAAPLVEKLAELLRLTSLQVETGRFGAEMLVTIENDGPVTIIIDSEEGGKG